MAPETLELLDAWYQGDRQALVTLVERLAPWMRSHVRRKMSTKMRRFETSEDVVQSVLLNLLRFGPAFRPANEQQFRALIAKAVCNRLGELHDYANAQARDPDQVEPFASRSSPIQIGAASSEQPARQASDAEERDFVRWALLLIEPDDKRVIHWHDFEGREFGEIGRLSGIGEDAARSRYRRALVRLRAQVDDLKRGQLENLRQELEFGGGGGHDLADS
jgi:RNA polymerase sigma factor (sigma-70 family)